MAELVVEEATELGTSLNLPLTVLSTLRVRDFFTPDESAADSVAALPTLPGTGAGLWTEPGLLALLFEEAEVGRAGLVAVLEDCGRGQAL